MNLFKRVASMLVILVMMLQIPAFAAPVPHDVVGTEYESAASLLCALNIMVGDGSNFKPNDDITRAEFAQIMMKSLALDDAAQAYEPVGMFSDVPKDNIFAPAVELGAGIGAIKGYGGGIFGPDDNVKGTEAVKMMIYAVGYDIQSESNGGYPTGYMYVARDIGMLKGLTNIDFSSPMTRGQAAILCANTLQVNVNKRITSGDSYKYVVVDGVSLLSEKHDVFKTEGIVTANDLTSMFQPSPLAEGRLQIEYGIQTGVYFEGETTIANALGKYVKAYYINDEETDKRTILSYEIVKNKNEIKTTPISNIIYPVTDAKVTYWANRETDKRPTELDMGTSPAIIYNGVARAVNQSVSATLNEIRGREGEVSFIDYNTDDIVDVLVVTAYETLVISKINAENFILTDKVTGLNKTIDIGNSDLRYEIVDAYNYQIAFEDLYAGDVLSIAMSDDGASRQYAKIIVAQDSISGEITEFSTDENNRFVLTINGVKYKTTAPYFNFITSGLGTSAPESSMRLRLGMSGKFHLDYFGRIAWDTISGTNSGTSFGLLTRYAKATGADTSIRLRIYVDGTYKDFLTANKLIVDGALCTGADATYTAIDNSLTAVIAATSYKEGDPATTYTGYYGDGTKISPLLFELDEEGKIIKIDTPYLNTSANESVYSLQSAGDQTLAFMQDTAYIKATSTIGGFKYSLPATVPVISLPTTAAEVRDAEKMGYITANNLPTTSGSIKYIQLLTTTPNSSKVEFALTKAQPVADAPETGTTEFNELQMFVVADAYECLVEDNKRTLVISGYMEGVYKEYTVKPDFYSSGEFYNKLWTAYADLPDYKAIATSRRNPVRDSMVVVPGDAMKVFVNSDGYLSWIEPIYLADAKLVIAPSSHEIEYPSRSYGFDVAILTEYLDGEGKFSYLLGRTKADNNTGTKTTLITTDANGFVTNAVSADSGRACDRNLVLYDSASQQYIFNDATAVPPITNGLRHDSTYDPSRFKIMVYDANKPVGKQVYAGSVADLYDTSFAGRTPASLVIMQFRGSNQRGMLVLKY